MNITALTNPLNIRRNLRLKKDISALHGTINTDIAQQKLNRINKNLSLQIAGYTLSAILLASLSLPAHASIANGDDYLMRHNFGTADLTLTAPEGYQAPTTELVGKCTADYNITYTPQFKAKRVAPNPNQQAEAETPSPEASQKQNLDAQG